MWSSFTQNTPTYSFFTLFLKFLTHVEDLITMYLHPYIMKKTVLLLSSLLFLLLLATSFFWLYEAKSFVGRASSFKNVFSLENSYVFLSPLRAKADNQEKIRVTVFVLNDQGLGVQGKKVAIDPAQGLTLQTIQGLTDNFGKAVFDITSSKAGEFFLSVGIEEKKLNQQPQLSFY